MQYTQLGRTGLTVSRLCLGTMNFGVDTSPPISFNMMDQALKLGINFFDTADVYGNPLGHGKTEELIGRWLAQGGGRRSQIVLATKLCNPMGPSPLDRGLSARHIRLACDASLRRLGTDYIDLYQMHHIDRGHCGPTATRLFDVRYNASLHQVDHGAHWDEIWQAMEQLVTVGKVLYVGSSNFAGWHLAHADALAEKRRFLGIISEQTKYNLATRTAELEVIPACEALGIGLIPWSPLGGGLLSGVQTNGNSGRRGRFGAEVLEQYRPQTEAYANLCAELGERPADVALAWLLANPVVTAPIIGPRTMDQLNHSVRALDIELTPEILAQLDEIWPGPGGPAPEAYAW